MIDLLSDEFNEQTLNPVKWKFRDSLCHNMSLKAWFEETDTTIQFNSNCLILKAQNKTHSVVCTDGEGVTRTFDYASGYICSQHTVRYGYYEIRGKMPANICIQPSFWTIGQKGAFQSFKYDEIDVFEFDPRETENSHYRQACLHRYPHPTLDSTIAKDIECKNVDLNVPFSSDTIVWGLEWLPTEINLFINSTWCNGFKYDSTGHYINRSQVGHPGLFTCVDFTYAIPQWIQLSLSLNEVGGILNDNLTEGWAIDWFRSYKLRQTNLNYWPSTISQNDPNLSKVHQSVRIGGDTLHSGVIPSNSQVTLWSKSDITLDKGFTVGPGTTLTLRAINPAPELFVIDEP
jgi:hypothetical protein